MRLGIDFGTTRIVVAAVDRGNYPVVTFEDPEGASQEWFPPLIAARGTERLYGWRAWEAQTDPSYTIIRSIKRTLEDAGPNTLVQIGEEAVPIGQLMEELMGELRSAILECSSLPIRAGEPLEVMLGVPANANSNQRFLTVEPARRAGFTVLGLLNEPSAASIEYGHRVRAGEFFERVLVYDLGGGTFDVSLVEIDDRTHSVIATEGVSTLGGDDFDLVLAECALDVAGISAAQRDALTQTELFLLHEECRHRKEALNANTRRITVDLSAVRETWPEVAVQTDVYYAACRPLVEKTAQAAQSLLDANEPDRKLEAVYVTGGGSELPLVSRQLKETFGRKVRRSPYTRSATAIGLAIQADEKAGYVLRDTFTRHFGVWREADGGHSVSFDVLFPKGTPLPAEGEAPVAIRRRYKPVHNIGHFRYLECSQQTDDGQPTGDITLWDEIRFAFDPALREAPDLAAILVCHGELSLPDSMEEYTCHAGGVVHVTIHDLQSGYSRQYHLGRWSSSASPITPGKRKRAAKR